MSMTFSPNDFFGAEVGDDKSRSCTACFPGGCWSSLFTISAIWMTTISSSSSSSRRGKIVTIGVVVCAPLQKESTLWRQGGLSSKIF